MNRADWLWLYSDPTSLIFRRTPAGWDVLLSLIEEGAIVPTGTTDAGGHALYVAVVTE